MKQILVFLFAASLVSEQSLAWDKRGHQIVGETAALLIAGEPTGEFIRTLAFDMGYYGNVPDYVWKSKNYDIESSEHFLDLEIFEAAFKKKPEIQKPFELSRKEFNEKFPEIKQDAGRALWRIRELNDKLTDITKQLRELEERRAERQALQGKWLVHAGVMGHYIGDLGQPLHVSENYDGQLSEQKGVHMYFERYVLDELCPKMNNDVHKDAVKEWPAFKKKNADKTVTELVLELTHRALKDLKPLLDLDKKTKRDAIAKNAKVYEKLIHRRLVDSSLVLAELYRRQLGWKYDNTKFYFFAGEPEYIKPGDVTAAK